MKEMPPNYYASLLEKEETILFIFNQYFQNSVGVVINMIAKMILITSICFVTKSGRKFKTNTSL